MFLNRGCVHASQGGGDGGGIVVLVPLTGQDINTTN